MPYDRKSWVVGSTIPVQYSGMLYEHKVSRVSLNCVIIDEMKRYLTVDLKTGKSSPERPRVRAWPSWAHYRRYQRTAKIRQQLVQHFSDEKTTESPTIYELLEILRLAGLKEEKDPDDGRH